MCCSDARRFDFMVEHRLSSGNIKIFYYAERESLQNNNNINKKMVIIKL